jgi:hypothetical protein
VQQPDNMMGLFKMPIEVEVHYKDGSVDSRKEWVEKEHHIMDILNPKGAEIDYVLFDPNDHILKTVSFQKSFAELKSQALHAPNMLDRYDALVALKTTDSTQKRQLLADIFNKESFRVMREEVVIQLRYDEDKGSEALLAKATHDKEAGVRLAAIQYVNKIPSRYRKDYEKLLTDSSYSVVENALTKLCKQFPKNKKSYLQKTDKVYGLGNSVRIAWLIQSFSGTSDSYSKELADYAGPSFEFRTRINAAQALQQLNYLDDTAIKNLLNATLSNNGRLARPASETLAYFYKQDKYKSKISDSVKSGNWTAAQKESLSKLLK